MTDHPTDDERSLERGLGGWLKEPRPPLPDRDAQVRAVLDEFPVTPQARRRSLGRWFERDEGARRRTDEHDHPPPDPRRTRLMFSATGLVAALAVLALGINVITTSDTQAPAAGSGATHVVAADGSGDYETIGAAVEAAADGDTVLVRPGTYTEAVVIDKAITLAGDGDREDIVLVAPDEGPTSRLREFGAYEDPYAVLVDGVDATVTNLSFRGEPSEVLLVGAAPTLSGSSFRGVGRVFDGTNLAPTGSSIAVIFGSRATVSGNEILDGGPISVFGGSTPFIESNTLSGGPHIYLEGAGDGTTISSNSIDGSLRFAIGKFDQSDIIIDGNTITDPGEIAVNLSSGPATVRGNKISGATLTGIIVSQVGGTVSGNELTDNRTGISYGAIEGLIEGNRIDGGGAGIVLVGSPTLRGNTVRGVETGGIAIAGNTSPTLSGNTSCDNGTNLIVREGATPQIDDTNEICEDASAG